MGTHPIFESDFDCLTERLNDQISRYHQIGDGGALLDVTHQY